MRGLTCKMQLIVMVVLCKMAAAGVRVELELSV